MKKILILCTGNSCRSQMAEGFLKKFISEKNIDATVFSAGIEAHGLNPTAVRVMNEAGVDISKQKSKTINDLLNSFPNGEGRDGAFAFVITVCDNARETCPYFPNAKKTIHHNFSDPAKANGNAEEILNEFRKVRDEIKNFCKDFLEKNFLDG